MEVFNDFDKLPTLDYSKQHYPAMVSDNPEYFIKKNKFIRMFDDNHVIKNCIGNLNYFEKLMNLKTNGIILPEKIFLTPNDLEDDFYVVSKYIGNAVALDNLICNGISAPDFIKIILKIIDIIKKCHQENFFIMNINYCNIFVSQEGHPFIVDLDDSCFIDDDNIIAPKNSFDYYFYDPVFGPFLYYYYYKPEYKCYCLNNQDLIPIFVFFDKLHIINILKEYLYYMKDITIEDSFQEYSNLNKLGLPSNIEKKLYNVFDGNVLDSDDYLETELQELLESDFVRSKNFS